MTLEFELLDQSRAGSLDNATTPDNHELLWRSGTTICRRGSDVQDTFKANLQSELVQRSNEIYQPLLGTLM